MTKRMRGALAATTLVAVCAFAAAASASADSLVPACPDTQVSQAFLRFLDPAEYVRAPGGGFEAGAQPWTLAGGAAVVGGNETYYLGSATDSRSLKLPSGSSATSPPMCVTMFHPTVRLLVRNTGSLLSTLKVEAVYRDGLGLLQTAPVALLVGTPTWQPTLPLPLLENLTALPLLTDGTLDVSFRFTSTGPLANWSVDDVYVDPYQGR
jgi:hypothetical protein